MLDEERRELDMYKRALACLTAEFADLMPESEGGKAAEFLRADAALIDEQSSSQSAYDGTAKEGTAQRRVARNDIKDFMKRFAQTARTIARRKQGFDEKYPTPHGKNDEQLLASAQSVAASALTDKTDFTGLGIPMEFINAAQTKTEAFADALNITNAALGSRGAAVGGRGTAFESAEDHFETLDTYIKNRYFDQPAKLAAWRVASHVERSPRRNKGGGTSPTT